MKLRGKESIKVIEELTGLNEEAITHKLEKDLAHLEGYDTVLYPTYESYFNDEFMGVELIEWLEDHEFQIVMKRFWLFVVNKSQVNYAALMRCLSGLVLIGDGMCENCGSDKMHEIARRGKTYGDGYFSQYEFVGDITLCCKNCGYNQIETR